METHQPLLFLFLSVFLFMVITSGGAETTEPEVFEQEDEHFHRAEGEAFYFVPWQFYKGIPTENITWYKNGSEEISTNKEELVHYEGGKLFFLNLKMEDSGHYMARYRVSSEKLKIYHLQLKVLPKGDKDLLFVPLNKGYQNIKVGCPDLIKETCKAFSGTYSWEKDNSPLPDKHFYVLWVENATTASSGIYTCTCTWKYNQKEYVTSGSRRVNVKKPVVHQTLRFLAPTVNEQLADQGSGITLNCSASCGMNAAPHCRAYWLIDGKPVNQSGYVHTSRIENPTKNTTAIAVLTIQKVTAKDFHSKFTCRVIGQTTAKNTTLTLKARESIVPLIVGGLCVSLLCVIAAALIKYFAIDLALFFRPFFQQKHHNKDGRVYDAYVVYKMQDVDKATEEALCRFVTKSLPSVLEEKCGYRLFIHGRDDLPGEDRLELVEDCMKQSRRLMVILTPGSGSGSSPSSLEDSIIEGFDWQVGLHHALVQSEMTVILIQLGDMGQQGYTHLPPALQHLIQKSAPIRWPKDARGSSAHNSRFWKKVRYLMPATPAKKQLQALIV
ncbi:interleukin-1 receptor type 1-like [Halichoeres trimaculatus]|uniref:interleukin-1 receptor type 1-like n=1 Tax=Halichoeres trimaculatus TaxID=147232 RepID=UPI003D9F7237